jgi:hypothetical protein
MITKKQCRAIVIFTNQKMGTCDVSQRQMLAFVNVQKACLPKRPKVRMTLPSPVWQSSPLACCRCPSKKSLNPIPLHHRVNLSTPPSSATRGHAG